MGEKAGRLNKLLELLDSGPADGGSLPELCRAIASRKNKEHALDFARTPYSERMVFVPQCLRAVGRCRAEERAAEYVCGSCGECKIAAVVERAGRLGYMGVRILKGGSAVSRVLDELRPAAVLGVACGFEGAVGMLECERQGIAVQFVPLLRDGCADTDVDIGDVLDAMEFTRP
jgi:hypothetical protein